MPTEEDIVRGVHQASASAGGSLCVSDDAEDRSWHPPCSASPSSAFGGELCRSSFEEEEEEADPESGDAAEIKLNLEKAEKDCRICQLGLESNAAESGIPIVLGCSCKDDLGAAHKRCAETWFNIRGNKTCEICGSTARNVVDMCETELTEHCHETSNSTGPRAQATETQGFWQGHRFLNFMLACMIFAFVVSWLFHFNVPG